MIRCYDWLTGKELRVKSLCLIEVLGGVWHPLSRVRPSAPWRRTPMLQGRPKTMYGYEDTRSLRVSWEKRRPWPSSIQMMRSPSCSPLSR